MLGFIRAIAQFLFERDSTSVTNPIILFDLGGVYPCYIILFGVRYYSVNLYKEKNHVNFNSLEVKK